MSDVGATLRVQLLGLPANAGRATHRDREPGQHVRRWRGDHDRLLVGGRVVLHRNDRGHDERGIFPAGDGVGGAAVRFAVDDPDACEREVLARGLTVLWPVQEAAWGRFVVLADPDGRSVVLAKMTQAPA
jgi:hypothetical protein